MVQRWASYSVCPLVDRLVRFGCPTTTLTNCCRLCFVVSANVSYWEHPPWVHGGKTWLYHILFIYRFHLTFLFLCFVHRVSHLTCRLMAEIDLPLAICKLWGNSVGSCMMVLIAYYYSSLLIIANCCSWLLIISYYWLLFFIIAHYCSLLLIIVCHCLSLLIMLVIVYHCLSFLSLLIVLVILIIVHLCL